ncbi:tetratricopeptide repeat protein [Tenacibaculum xiamenense]|uniref:hypothetical protein n=1 Tax=Tenacibaculum xiamenense TaxID=1261553 RepID=UPI0038955825
MEDQYLLFDKYLNDELSEEELTSFNEKVSSDIEFEKEFLLYKETHNFLKNTIEKEDELASFKKNLNKASNSYFSKPHSTKKGVIFTFAKYAAVLFTIIFAIYMYQTSMEDPSYDSFVTYRSIDITVRNSENELATKAENSFNHKDFKSASKYLYELIQLDENNTEFKLYYGFSLIELNEFQKADNILSSISERNSAYKNTAIWYLSLSKLKQKDYQSCKNILSKIDKNSPEFDLAKPLISKLK